ncbi:phage integrase N-terminal SAM-like domain-containing protein [uncultured Limosilactobacillus sp.]|uniref:phage integrase N-terminal SAM-like domain-containing protein n=1 Tax=uncultured Limosilactobacillus sp. TaxID=2837629 RepID=UPI0025CFD8DA|nr:phage integrase N-terminal SAM-like domain-containing protein [uncultured Limosilactobacillus sp.]
MSSYPAEQGFTTFLTNQGLATATIDSYGQTIRQLLTFLAANRPSALANSLNSVNTTDLRAYLNYLQAQRQITLNSYNKTLAQLNRYFTYLFENQLIKHYPTLPLHGKAVQVTARTHSGEWLNKLPRILADQQVSFYTRLTLLLLAHGFTVREFLQPGFVHSCHNLTPVVSGEKQFWTSFAAFHQPLDSKQQCEDLFLKQRTDLANPRLSNSALHKYLHSDERYLGMELSPTKLHQDYLLSKLRALQGEPNSIIMQKLNLTPASLLYYQRLLVNQQ